MINFKHLYLIRNVLTLVFKTVISFHHFQILAQSFLLLRITNKMQLFTYTSAHRGTNIFLVSARRSVIEVVLSLESSLMAYMGIVSIGLGLGIKRGLKGRREAKRGWDSCCSFRGMSNMKVYTLDRPLPKRIYMPIIRNIQPLFTIYKVVEYIFSLFIIVINIMVLNLVYIWYVQCIANKQNYYTKDIVIGR